MNRENRFAFGKNWQSFRAEALNAGRITEAEKGLVKLFRPGGLEGKSFLDIGSGSGLMSLAARRLGAERVVSFDYDADSVACTRAVRDQYAPSDASRWTVLEGSALDSAFMQSLGKFDIVYSWGVLHHTGDMWRAIELSLGPVADGGTLALALYNRISPNLTTLSSQTWHAIKSAYVQGSPLRRRAMLGTFLTLQMTGTLLSFRNPIGYVRNYRSLRGMSWFHDARDWLGGYPYEFASTEEVVAFVTHRGFRSERLFAEPPSSWGNNEFVFVRVQPS